MSFHYKDIDFNHKTKLKSKELISYLKKHIKDFKDDIYISRFPNGFSNLTFLLESNGKEAVLRCPAEQLLRKRPYSIKREYQVLKALHPLFPLCPKVISFCSEPHIADCEFYLMEKIPGIVLNKNFTRDFKLSPEELYKLSKNLVKIQAKLHSLDTDKIDFIACNEPENYIDRQIRGWAQRFQEAYIPDSEDLALIISWLIENQPPDRKKPSLIHNDLKLDNIVLNPEKPEDIVGVLDWEMATIGDPFMDLGVSMAYWINENDSEKIKFINLLPDNLKGIIKREDFISEYEKIRGVSIKDFNFYYIFGLFRMAVIAQQMRWRIFHSKNLNEAFIFFTKAIIYLKDVCLEIIDKKIIS